MNESKALEVLKRHVNDLHDGICYGESIDDMDAVLTSVRELISGRNALLDGLHKLIDAASDSDSCQYGTLETSFVRSICEDAIALAGGSK